MTSSKSFSELAALLCAAAVLLAGLGAVAVNAHAGRGLVVDDLRAGVVVSGLTLGIWLSFQIARFPGDGLLLAIVSMLLSIGLVMIYRLQPDLVKYRNLQVDLAERHLFYVVATLLLIWFIALFGPDPERIANYRYLILLAGIGLLVLTAAIGTDVGGARLWIDIGPVSIQPAEFVKLALVAFLASYLAEKNELVSEAWRIGPLNLPPLPYLLPVALMAGVCLLILLLLNDLGTALLFISILLAMLYAASGRGIDVVIGLALFLIAATIAYFLVDRLQIRVSNWIDPWHDPFYLGYQQIQSDYAIATGGILGVGIGRGSPQYIPAVQTDYVFSVISEEAGLIGGLGLIACFVLLVARGFNVANRVSSDVNRLMAIGLTSALAIQAAVIVGGVLRLVPLTGITLPFVSVGGSSLLANGIAVGLLLKISATQRKPGS